LLLLTRANVERFLALHTGRISADLLPHSLDTAGSPDAPRPWVDMPAKDRARVGERRTRTGGRSPLRPVTGQESDVVGAN